MHLCSLDWHWSATINHAITLKARSKGYLAMCFVRWVFTGTGHLFGLTVENQRSKVPMCEGQKESLIT